LNIRLRRVECGLAGCRRFLKDGGRRDTRPCAQGEEAVFLQRTFCRAILYVAGYCLGEIRLCFPFWNCRAILSRSGFLFGREPSDINPSGPRRFRIHLRWTMRNRSGSRSGFLFGREPSNINPSGPRRFRIHLRWTMRNRSGHASGVASRRLMSPVGLGCRHTMSAYNAGAGMEIVGRLCKSPG